MPTVFSPENRDVNPIQGVRNTPNSVIPTGLSNVNINPVNISPFFSGEQSRRANISTELAIKNQALGERRQAFVERKYNTDLALSVIKGLDNDMRQSAKISSKVDQNKLLNSNSGLDVESDRQAALAIEFEEDANRAKQFNNDLINGFDLDSELSASDITRLSQDFEKNNSIVTQKWNKHPEYQKFRRLNASALKFTSLMENSKSPYDYAAAHDMKQRLDYHRGIKGNYSDDIINSTPPGEDELVAALQPYDYEGTMTQLQKDISAAFKAVDSQTVEKIVEGGDGDDVVYQINELTTKQSGQKALGTIRKLVDSPKNDINFKNLARRTFSENKKANPLLTQEQHLANVKQAFIDEQLRVNQIEGNSLKNEITANEKITLKTAKTAKPASTGGGSTRGGSNTRGERDFAADQKVFRGFGLEIDSTDTKNIDLIERAGGLRALTIVDLGNGKSKIDVPLYLGDGSVKISKLTGEQEIREVTLNNSKGGSKKTKSTEKKKKTSEFKNTGKGAFNHDYKNLGDGTYEIKWNGGKRIVSEATYITLFKKLPE